MLRAFKVYVRPLLEYATSVWSLYFNYAIDKIESVQRKFTKRLKGCKYLDYTTKLSFLNLPSLERRRLTADLANVDKILRACAIMLNLGNSVVLKKEVKDSNLLDKPKAITVRPTSAHHMSSASSHN